MGREGPIQRRVIALLKEYGAWVLNVHGSAYQRKGVPDVLACLRGRFIAIECKQPGEAPDRLQEHEMKRLRERGAIVLVVDGDLEPLRAALDAVLIGAG